VSAAQPAAAGPESTQAPTSAPAGDAAEGTQPADSAAPGSAAPASKGPTVEQLRAQWATDKVQSERAQREAKQLLREREARIAELEQKAALADDPIKLFESAKDKRKLYNELTKRFVGADKEPTPEEQAAVEREAKLQQLLAEAEERKANESRTAAEQLQAQRLKGVADWYEANAEKYPLTKALGAYTQAVGEYDTLHKSGRRMSDEEIAEHFEEKISRTLDAQLDTLLASSKFRDLLQAKIAKQQPARQAKEGDEDDANDRTVRPIVTLSNALSSEAADEVDWSEMPDHEIRRRALAAARKSRVNR
jgi:hypothetical protein